MVTTLQQTRDKFETVALHLDRNFRYLFVASTMQAVLYISLELTQFYVSMMGDSDNKILEVFGMMPCTVVTILGSMKSVILVMKRSKLCKLVESLEQMWPNTENLQVKRIVVDNMVKTKKFIVFYMAQITILAILWSLFPISIIVFNLFMKVVYKSARPWNQDVDLPYVVWHPFDIHASVLNYASAYVSQVYCGMIFTSFSYKAFEYLSFDLIFVELQDFSCAF